MTSGNASKDTTLGVRYEVEEKPPLRETVPLGLQHVLVMFSGNVSIPLIQTIGFGPIGARLPVVMGTSIGFVLVAVPIAQGLLSR